MSKNSTLFYELWHLKVFSQHNGLSGSLFCYTGNLYHLVTNIPVCFPHHHGSLLEACLVSIFSSLPVFVAIWASVGWMKGFEGELSSLQSKQEVSGGCGKVTCLVQADQKHHKTHRPLQIIRNCTTEMAHNANTLRDYTVLQYINDSAFSAHANVL